MELTLTRSGGTSNPRAVKASLITVLTAGWLHGNLLHIGFNMLGVWQLLPSIAELYGPGRTVIIYTVAGVCGFLLSSTIGFFVPGMPFLGAYYTVGASASIFHASCGIPDTSTTSSSSTRIRSSSRHTTPL